jgi:hypothetical protein
VAGIDPVRARRRWELVDGLLGRRAEWVGPVLFVIEIGVLFLCAFAWLVHGPVIGSVVFGGLSTALLVLLALPAGRARSAALGRP